MSWLTCVRFADGWDRQSTTTLLLPDLCLRSVMNEEMKARCLCCLAVSESVHGPNEWPAVGTHGELSALHPAFELPDGKISGERYQVNGASFALSC